MSYNKILTHPSKTKIVRMLTQGLGVREVAKRLRAMHPGDKKLHLSVTTLQKFRKEKLNLEGDVLDAVKDATKVKVEDRDSKKLDTHIKHMPEYKEKLKEALDVHIDIRQQLKNLFVLIDAKSEDIFNRAQNGQASTNEEQNLIKYLQSSVVLIEKWAKYVDKIADQTIETNVNITVIEDQVSVIRECIRETFNETDPELAIKFFEKLERKMGMLSYRQKNQSSFSDFNKEVKTLVANVAEIEPDEQ